MSDRPEPGAGDRPEPQVGDVIGLLMIPFLAPVLLLLLLFEGVCFAGYLLGAFVGWWSL